MNIAIPSSSAEIMSNPDRVVDAMRAGQVVQIPDLNYTAVMRLAEALATAEDEDADMASLTPDQTGVDNSVFVSTKGNARHAALIKIAIDPPNSFNAASTQVTIAIHDYNETGEGLTPKLREQAKRFIDHNRDLLLEYWVAGISTREFIDRVRPPPP
jgi:hypothetical protein